MNEKRCGNVVRVLVCLLFLELFAALSATAEIDLSGLGPQQLVSASALTNIGTFFMATREEPPLPFLSPMLQDLGVPVYQTELNGFPVYVVDDRELDWDEIMALDQELRSYESSSAEGPPSPPGAGEGEGGGGGGTNSAGFNYGPGDMWLSIDRSTNTDFVILTLHNAPAIFCQLHSTFELSTNIDWTPGEIVVNTNGLTNIVFTPIASRIIPRCSSGLWFPTRWFRFCGRLTALSQTRRIILRQQTVRS